MAADKTKQKKQKTKLKDSIAWKTYSYFLPGAWKKYKMYFVLRFIKLFAQAAIPFVDLIMLPKLVDELVGDRRADMLILYVLIMGVGTVLLNFVNTLCDNYIDRYADKFSYYYKEQASLKIMELDFQVTEDTKALDQIEKARNGMDWYSGGLNGIVSSLFYVIQNVITLLGVSAIILIKAPILLVLILVVLYFTGMLNRKNNEIEQKSYMELSVDNRIFSYLGWQVVDFRYGKDIRLYEAKDMLLKNYQKYSKRMNDKWYKMATLQLLPTLLMDLCDVVRDFGSYLYIGTLAILGKISLGITTQLFTASAQLYINMRNLVGNVQEVIKKTNYAYEYVKFMEFPNAIHHGTKPVAHGPHVFEFKDVEFTYPGSEVKVLKGVNLKIEAGENLSIVGLNGAGKTTFVKLLCRLYDPTSGVILMDGVDIREYDYDSYMQEFAPVFQDFKLFAFTMEENITLGIGQNDEARRAAVMEVIERVGLKDKVDSLEKGVETYVFKHYDESGIEPSGGEQQKLAIGRALYKKSPVIILDEPTAALDPVAEYEIYRKFEELVGGKTAVYISHRLSSCRFCDKIAVFANGVVSEYGNHESLVNKENGIYAEMFAAQAQYYQTT